MRADGDCPEVSAIMAKPVEYGKARGANGAARVPAEQPRLPACAHCCAKRIQLRPLLQHLFSERERQVQQAIKIVLTLPGSRVSPRGAIAPDLPPPWIPIRRHKVMVRARHMVKARHSLARGTRTPESGGLDCVAVRSCVSHLGFRENPR
jgi:hypothetical protein